MKDSIKDFTAEELEAVRKYRVKSGVVTAIAVVMYIVCWIPMVVMGVLAEKNGADTDLWGVIGLGVMMLIIAAATAMLIMTSFLKPACLIGKKIKLDDDDDDDDDDDGDNEKGNEIKRRRNPILSAVLSAMWSLTVVVYLCLGFGIGLWHPGWVIFILAGALERIIDAVFDSKGKKYIEDNRYKQQ